MRRICDCVFPKALCPFMQQSAAIGLMTPNDKVCFYLTYSIGICESLRMLGALLSTDTPNHGIPHSPVGQCMIIQCLKLHHPRRLLEFLGVLMMAGSHLVQNAGKAHK